MTNTNTSRKKGQAAIEFLVTYGWAIMAAMIVLGALSYFGVFNTQKYTRDVCYFGDQLICEDNIAYTNGTVKIQIRNNMGADINVSAAVMRSDYGLTNCTRPTAVVTSGALFEVICRPSTVLGNNDKFQYSSIITFARQGSGNRHNQTGDVTTTVHN